MTSPVRADSSMTSDIQIYCDCMARIRDRINAVSTILAGPIPSGFQDQVTELIFVQFRKVLEEIAFASLSANREKYSEVHANFSKHWRVNEMLAIMDKVNPNFFPMPVPPPVETAPGFKHFGETLTEGVLTREDFAFLYKRSSEVLHTRNPYREDDRVINIKHSVQEWVSRFQGLLSWHITELLSGEKWVVNIPAEGLVRAWPAVPVEDTVPEQAKEEA
jgi:hypothetical protein